LLPIVSVELLNVIELSGESAKALLPIEVTDAGSESTVIGALLKAPLPMVVTPEPNCTLASDAAPEKLARPIVVTESGMVSEVSNVLPKLAIPMLVTELGMVRLVIGASTKA
jgi:hypothetical protein